MKRIIAALLILTMVFGLCGTAMAAAPKFSKSDANTNVYAKFQANLNAYKKAKNSAKTSTVVKKGSVAFVLDVSSNGKWVQLKLTNDGIDEKGNEYDQLVRWFKVDKLKRFTASGRHIQVTFTSSSVNKKNSFHYVEFPNKVSGLVSIGKVKTSDKAAVRTYACQRSKSRTSVPKGKKVKLTGKWGCDTRGVYFVQVKYNNKTGYISTESIASSSRKRIKKVLDAEMVRIYG